MSTLTKLALGAMGQLRPRPAKGDALKALPLPVLSGLLWVAFSCTLPAATSSR